MSRPKVIFWLGSYSVRKGSPSGIGQRVIQLARGLREICDIKVCCTQMETEPDPAIVDALTTEAQRDLCWAQALYCFDNVPPEIVKNCSREGKAVVAENHTPVEHCYYNPNLHSSAACHQAALATYRAQLEVADKFIVRSQAERTAVLDGLCVFGRLTCAQIASEESLARLVEIIPIGVLHGEVARHVPNHKGEMTTIVWNGGLYDFHDPAFLVDAISSLASQGLVHLHFPFPAESNSRVMRSLGAALDRNGLNGAVSVGSIGAARAALRSGGAFIACVGRRSVENELCQRLRTREIFLFRSPMIVDGYGATGAWVHTNGIGTVLDGDIHHAAGQIASAIEPRNRRLLVEAIDRYMPEVLLDQPLARLGADLDRLVRSSARRA